jgi:hypothetical protein
MVQYDYKVLKCGFEHTEEYLNTLGAEGWKIVGTSNGSYGLHAIFMMREI